MFLAKPQRLLAVSAIALAAFAAPVSAQQAVTDAEAFVTRLVEAYGVLGYDLEFGAARAEDGNVVVDGLSLGIEAGGGAPAMGPAVIEAELTFTNVTETADGAYFADSLVIPASETEITAEDGTSGLFSLSATTLTGLYVPPGDVTAADTLTVLGGLEIGPMSLTSEGSEVFAIDSISAQSSFNPPIGEGELIDLSSELLVSGLRVDLSTIEDESLQASLSALGLQTLEGSVTQTFDWSMADGRLTMDQFLFDFTDLGALDIVLDVTGLTPALLDELTAMNEAVETATASGDTAAMEQQQMLMGMQLMQGLSIAGASIRYDDASLASTLIELNAEEAGVSRADMVEGFKLVLPELLAESPIPALNDTIVAALSAFLDDPQSLEITVAPDSPMNVLVVMGAAANPASLVDLLGLGIAANQ